MSDKNDNINDEVNVNKGLEERYKNIEKLLEQVKDYTNAAWCERKEIKLQKKNGCISARKYILSCEKACVLARHEINYFMKLLPKLKVGEKRVKKEKPQKKKTSKNIEEIKKIIEQDGGTKNMTKEFMDIIDNNNDPNNIKNAMMKLINMKLNNSIDQNTHVGI
jgi:dsDNA-specific endonuclease/ATPase MutS2